MEMHLKDVVIEELSNYICFLKIKGVDKPYTSKKDICKVTIENSNKINKLRVYNLLSKKVENLFFDEIEEITVHDKDNKNVETSIQYIDQINLDLNDCSLKYISKDELLEYYLKNAVYLVNSEKEIFDICKKFEFAVRDYEIKANIISNIDILEKVWNKIIKLKVDENINELNEIKNEADDKEDIEDIEDIIEMFNETINEVDLTDCKNLIDVIDTYPPLLLPLPDELKSIKDKINSSDDSTLDAALSLVETMTYDELQEIYNEISEIKDTNYVVTKVIDKIKKILDKTNQ
jgi:hypothetical protein